MISSQFYHSHLRLLYHYNDAVMGAIASQITSLTIVYSTVYSDADQRKHQSSASLAFVRGIPRGPVNSPHKWPATRNMFPFDDVIMNTGFDNWISYVKTTASVKQSICISWVGFSLQWRHNDHDRVSNHQPHGCLLNRLFRRRSKKTSKLRVTGLCVGNSPGPVNSPHKVPVTRKMVPFDDVIM